MEKRTKQILILVLTTIVSVIIAVAITVFSENHYPNDSIEIPMVVIFVEASLLFFLVWSYLKRDTSISTRFGLKLTSGMALTPFSSMFITDLALHRDNSVIWYLFFAAIPVLGFLFGDSRTSDEAFRKSDLQRGINIKEMHIPKRNEPCSCGSGLKYKHCCGKATNLYR